VRDRVGERPDVEKVCQRGQGGGGEQLGAEPAPSPLPQARQDDSDQGDPRQLVVQDDAVAQDRSQRPGQPDEGETQGQPVPEAPGDGAGQHRHERGGGREKSKEQGGVQEHI